MRAPCTTGITDALADALAHSEPQARREILAWMAGRGLLGLAHESGFGAAAEHAYRMADTLAGAVH